MRKIPAGAYTEPSLALGMCENSGPPILLRVIWWTEISEVQSRSVMKLVHGITVPALRRRGQIGDREGIHSRSPF